MGINNNNNTNNLSSCSKEPGTPSTCHGYSYGSLSSSDEEGKRYDSDSSSPDLEEPHHHHQQLQQYQDKGNSNSPLKMYLSSPSSYQDYYGNHSLTQQHHQQEEEPPPPDKKHLPKWHRHWTQHWTTWVGLLGGVILGALISRYPFFYSNHHHSVPSSSSSSSWSTAVPQSTNSTATPTSSGDEQHSQQEQDKEQAQLYYDYIVVGGGPSGVIAATKLAKTLPDTRVLLLESGTVSQTSVYESTAATTTTDAVTIPPNNHINNNNKYDIPLFWSAAASIQRRTQETFHLPPDPKTSTYWPIPMGLLARGLGGCGLVNAMIYIRSLPSCFAQWNLTSTTTTTTTTSNNNKKNPWTFDQMLSVYKELEAYSSLPTTTTTKRTTSDTATIPDFRGQTGPLHTLPTGPDMDVIGDYFVQSAQNHGVPMAGGSKHGRGFNHPNATDRIGVGYYEFNIHNGVRDSVAHALLGNPHDIPSNLDIWTGKTVTNILWDTTDNNTRSSTSSTHPQSKPRAVGVAYLDVANGNTPGEILLKPTTDEHNSHDKSSSTTSPLPEVILATGAIMTPQLLWNSGIGDNGTLVNLPGVGKELQDHPVLGMAYQLSEEMTMDAPQLYTVGDDMEDYTLAVQTLQALEQQQKQQSNNTSSQQDKHDAKKNRKQQEMWRQQHDFAASQLGMLGTAGFTTGGFLRSPWAEEIGGEIAPDIQLTVFPRVVEPHQPKSQNKINVQMMRSRAMLVTVALLQPEARYQVKPNVLNQEGEVRQHTVPYTTYTPSGDDMAAAFSQEMQYPLPSIRLPDDRDEYLTDKDVKRLAWGMQQVRKILDQRPLSDVIVQELYPGPSVQDDSTLSQYIRANHLANSHWVGSTKLGPDEDPMAVLDERLRVRKVQGLRVFDSGAIPRVPNGNTHSTVCAVSSRGVDLIVEDRVSNA